MKKVIIALSVLVLIGGGLFVHLVFGYSNHYVPYDHIREQKNEYGELSDSELSNISGTYHLINTDTINATLTVSYKDETVYVKFIGTDKAIGSKVKVINDKLEYNGSRYLKGDKMTCEYKENQSIELRFIGFDGIGLYNGTYVIEK